MPIFKHYKEGDILGAADMNMIIAELKRLGRISGGGNVSVTTGAAGISITGSGGSGADGFIRGHMYEDIGQDEEKEMILLPVNPGDDEERVMVTHCFYGQVIPEGSFVGCNWDERFGIWVITVAPCPQNVLDEDDEEIDS